MNLLNRFDNFVNDKEYKIIYTNNNLNIINYLKIIDFNSTLIKIENKNNITIIKGNKLVISKLMEDELLITGDINLIEFSDKSGG